MYQIRSCQEWHLAIRRTEFKVASRESWTRYNAIMDGLAWPSPTAPATLPYVHEDQMFTTPRAILLGRLRVTDHLVTNTRSNGPTCV